MVDVKGKGKEIAGKSSSTKRKSSRTPDGEASSCRKHRRSAALRFFDHMANVDDEDDDEDDDSDSDYLSDDGMDLEDYGKQQKHNQIPFPLKEEEANNSEIGIFFRERYKRGSKYGSHAEEAKGSDEENSSMQFHGDPIMWKVKCSCGHERKLVVCLMQKLIDLHSVGKKMEIKSTFCLDNVKGYIYLEADRHSDIVEVCKGLFGIFTNTIVHIPSNEILYLFSVRGASMGVSRGEWVRVKHGTYKGDLAKVIDVDDRQCKSATIKLVPRVDLQAVVNKIDGKKSTKKGTAVPAPHLIHAYELEKLQQFVKLKRNKSTGEVFETIGSLTLKDGFLYKKVRLESLNCWDVRPSDIELEQFKDSKRVSTKDHQWLSKLYGERRNNKSKEVNKVDNGKGSSSLVSCDMRECELFDLVFFEKKKFGVIIGIHSDNFQILKGNCERLETTAVAVRDIKKQQWEEDTSLDHNSNPISLNDVVRILKGPFKGKQGIVKHIIQGLLFIYDNNQIEANGFCCAQTKNCEAIKYSHGPSDESLFGPVPPGFETSTSLSTKPEPEQPTESPFQHRERPASAGLRSRSSNEDFYVGQTLRIRVGPLKGYLCRVIDAYRSDITVKLDSQMKIIKVKVDDVTMVVAKGYGSVARDEWTRIPSASADLNQNDSWNRPSMQWNEREVMSTDLVDGWGKPASERNKTDGAMSSDSWGKDVGGWANERDGRQNHGDDKAENREGSTNQWEREAAACGRADSWPGGAGGWNNERDERSPTDDKMESWDKKEVAARVGPCSWEKAAGGWASKGDQSDVKTQTSKEAQTGLDDKAECWGKPTSGWEDKMGNTSRSHCEDWNEQQDKAGVAVEDQVDFLGSNEVKEKGANWSQGASWEVPSNAWNKPTDAAGGQADCCDVQDKGKDASSGQVNGWDKTEITEGNQGDGWSKASNSQQENKGGGWDRTEDQWNKGKNAAGDQVGCSEKASGGWGKQTDGAQADSWHSGCSQSRQDGSGWQKSGGWSESGLVGGSEYGGWNKSNHGNESRSYYQRMDSAPGRSRGRGRWNGIGGQTNNWRKPRTECSDNANSFHGQQLGGWQKNEKIDRENQSGHRKKIVSDASGKQAGGGGGSWERAETGGSNKLDGWGNTSESKSVVADTGGKDAGSWRMLSGSQTWDESGSADRSTLHEERGGWGMSSASQSRKKMGSGDGNASDDWGKVADNNDTSAYASREAVIWGMPSVSQSISSASQSWKDYDSAGRNALNCWEKAAEGRNIAADTGKVDGLGGVFSESQSWEKKQSADGNASDASRIDTETGNRVVDTSGKDDGAWGKYSTSQSWDTKENTGGDALDGWSKGTEDRNGAVDIKVNEADRWEKSSGFQHQDRTENAKGNASGGWEDSTNESSKGHGGWGKLSGSQSWGGSSGGWAKAADGWKKAAGASANEVGDWGKANTSSGSHSWEKAGNASTNNSDGWGKVEDGWKSTSNPTKSYTGGDLKNSVPTSWEKVNDWQQSAETGEDSKTMHEDGSKGWNKPSFGGSGRAGYPGRARGPPRADGRGLLGRGPSDGNGRGGRGSGSFDRFGKGGLGRGRSDGNGRGGFRGRGPYGGSTRNWNRDDDGGQPGNWSKPVEPESLGGNQQWNRADEGSHKSGSWSSWSTASGWSGQTNDDQRRQKESQNEGGNQQWNGTDPAGGNESGPRSSWASAAGCPDQAKDENEGSGW